MPTLHHRPLARIAPVTAVVVALGLSAVAPPLRASASALGPSSAQRRALAAGQARRLLELVALPAGATRLAHWEPTLGPALRSPMSTPGDTDHVDLARFYLVPGGSRAERWIRTHPPRGATLSGSGSGSSGNAPSTNELTYSFAGTALLPSPELVFTTVVTTTGSLALRVDAFVEWTPRKSPYALISEGARLLVVTIDRGLNVTKGRVTTLSVTTPSTIATIRHEVNQLPVLRPGQFACPADLGERLTISFVRRAGEHPYAVVVADPGGCGVVTVTAYDASGRAQGTGSDSGGYALTRAVATSLSIKNWRATHL